MPEAKPQLSRNSRQIMRKLQQSGFVLVSVRGSHHKFRHPETGKLVILPHPRDDIPLGTVRSIYRQAGWLEGSDD
jgi:predicted RNA binding protein YcfA (HicA-like mRNA interferase family)